MGDKKSDKLIGRTGKNARAEVVESKGTLVKKDQSKLHEYRFKIDAYKPTTMPLGRLAEYMADLSVMLGESASVHLIGIEEGSHVSVIRIDREAEPKIRDNVAAVERKEAPPERMRASARLKEKLRQDNADGARLIDPVGSNVIAFPVRDEDEPLAYGPFTQAGIIVGIPRAVGGDNDPVPVHLRGADGRTLYCQAKEDVALAIAQYLFTTVIRAEGTGRWIRNTAGEWVMDKFTIKDFKPLSDVSLRDAIRMLREIPAEWKDKEDPLGELRDIRHGTDG